MVAPRFLTFCLTLGLLINGLTGCGYQLQNRRNPLEQLGIKTVFVQGFRNKSYRPGLEHFFTTAMVREIKKAGVLDVTNHKESADAVLTGTVINVEDDPSGASVKLGDGRDTSVATSFAARVGVYIELRDRDGRAIFSEMFTGTKNHLGSLVISGDRIVDQYANATAPLINESEQRLAVRYLAEQLMFDAYQRLVEVF